MVQPKVYIIILNWNSLVDTEECLSSLEQSMYRNVQIVVVDNGSEGDSHEVITSRHPQVKLIKNPKNEGFCGGNNIGIRFALERDAEYIWLLNNDCVVENDTLAKLVQRAEASASTGMVSPVVYYHDQRNRVQYSGSKIDFRDLTVQYPENRQNSEARYQTGSNVVLWGTALLIKRSVIERIGFLNEKFFAYWEDTDLSLRCLRAGYRNEICEGAHVLHKRKLTCDGKEAGKSEYFYYFLERNYLLMRRPEYRGPFAGIRFALMALARGSAHVVDSSPERARVILTGVWHGLNGIGGPFQRAPAMPRLLILILCGASRLHPMFIYYMLTFNMRAVCSSYNRWRKRNTPSPDFSSKRAL